ncbi:MAG: two-componenthybrid sensor histidine kinase [Gemmatimonadetes bacterium]|nr:two-componenthybrid sensor histidine kinase [Gemmatimonadota bacterium]
MDTTMSQLQSPDDFSKDSFNPGFDPRQQEVSANLRASHQSLSTALADAETVALHMMQLQEVTAALSKARTEDEVADIVLRMGLGVVAGVAGVLARVDGESFQRIAAVGFAPELQERVLAMTRADECPLISVAKSGEQLWLRSRDEHVNSFGLVYERLGIPAPEASAAVPLFHGSEIVGVLSVIFENASAFGAVKQAFTLLLAQVAADALARARSYDVERGARRGAESIAQARADVLAIVAHDLRNPLSVISSSSALLLEMDELPIGQRRKLLETTQRAARRMNRLIGDLLDATRLQAGRLTLELRDVDACKIIRESEETLGPSAAERHIDLRVFAPDSDCWVRADEGRLLQVIGNLVGNALKFTTEGGRVTLSAERRECEVVFNVSDNGPGIPAEDQSRLFESFWQARSGDSRGVGLGLSITKDLVSALEGRLWVDSVVGSGSTFAFALPSAQATQH